MRINATERVLLMITAAFVLFFFGYFLGNNQVDRGVSVHSESALQSEAVSQEPDTQQPSNEGRLPEQEIKSEKVNLNTADLAELTTLPGIGAVLAQRILDYRAEHGGFGTVQELTKVDGIGEKTLANVLNLIVVG